MILESDLLFLGHPVHRPTQSHTNR